MFRPPIDRAMRVLDRAFFKKTVPLAAVKMTSNTQIAPFRKLLGRDILSLEWQSPVKSDPLDKNAPKCLLLRPEIRPNDPSTWTPKLSELVDSKQISIAQYDLKLSYDDWNYHDIIDSVLPDEGLDDKPAGFAAVGHVAHLNLRDHYLPYKNLIASILMDKNSTIRTVIRKVDDVGQQNEFRTFQYELLAGDPSLDVELREQDCVHKFNYAQVYWNTRLSTEHERLVKQFTSGEAVCDVMAGIGPFAIPAGKKRVFVWANDLNPDSYRYLSEGIQRNKVGNFVRSFNSDGWRFIRESAIELLEDDYIVELPRTGPKVSRSLRDRQPPPPPPILMTRPKTFDHYVMNLPASAVTFLDAFVGLYRKLEYLFEPTTFTKLPMIHVYFFSVKEEGTQVAENTICEEISKRMGHKIQPEDELTVFNVRDVAPNKRQFCASFRLPAEVAFRSKDQSMYEH